MQDNAERLKEFLRQKGHRNLVFVEQNDAYTCTRVYCARDPGGVLRSPAYTLIQTDLACVAEAVRLLGSCTASHGNRSYFILKSKIVHLLEDGRKIFSVQGIRSVPYSIVEEEFYAVPLDGGRIAVASTANGLLKAVDKLSATGPFSTKGFPKLPDLKPASSLPKPSVRFDRHFLIVRSDEYLSQLDRPNVQSAN